jgi:hypothetical protein
METSNIRAAINDARKERETLAAKLSELDAFIAHGEMLLNRNSEGKQTDLLLAIPQKKGKKTSQPRKTRKTKKDAVWVRARTVLKETGNVPMRVSDMLQEFRKRNWDVSEKNGKEVLRYSLKHKPTVFFHDPEAFTYCLKELHTTALSPVEQQQ